jgi:hypothetical protein
MKKGLVIALLCAGIITVAAVSFNVPTANVLSVPKPGV